MGGTQTGQIWRNWPRIRWEERGEPGEREICRRELLSSKMKKKMKMIRSTKLSLGSAFLLFSREYFGLLLLGLLIMHTYMAGIVKMPFTVHVLWALSLVYNSYLYDFAQGAQSFIKMGTGYITDPPRDKVLPKEFIVPGLIPKKKVLVLHLDDMLVHKELKLGETPSIALRPGLKRFLEEMNQHYQLVIISEHHTEVAEIHK